MIPTIPPRRSSPTSSSGGPSRRCAPIGAPLSGLVSILSVAQFVALSVALFVALSAPVAAQAAGGDDYELEYVDGEIVVHLNGTVSIEQLNARWGTYTIEAYPPADLYLIGPVQPGNVADLADILDEDPAVISADPNFVQDTPEGIRHLLIVAVGGGLVDYQDQQITQRIGLDAAHQVTRGAGTVIAILDTGVDPAHEALAGRLAPNGFDFVDGDDTPWESADGLDSDGDGLTDEGFGHGTMVAAIAALVAPDAMILPVRVLNDDARADIFTICKAIRYAISQGADVLNLSFGIPHEIRAVDAQLDYVEDEPVLIVAGAGNQNRGDAPFFPAASGKVLMVTALDSLDVKAGFADWGADVDLAAPGTGVRSAYPGGGWALGAGCSFATPFVSGAAALAIGYAPNLPQEEWEDCVLGAVDPVDQLTGNAPYVEMLGSGRVYLPGLFDAISGATPSAMDRSLGTVAPNPTRGFVSLRLDPADAAMSGPLRITDATGRHVAWMAARGDAYGWDARGENGQKVPAGVYFVRSEKLPQRAATIHVVR